MLVKEMTILSEIPYVLHRSKRKTLSISIDMEANLVVRAPLWLSEASIEEFINRKNHWIITKQNEVREQNTKKQKFILIEGSKLSLLGQIRRIQRIEIDEVMIDSSFIYIPLSMDQNSFYEWLKGYALRHFQSQVDYYAKMMGLSYKSLRVSEARKRWGSCGANNSLNLSWRLILCPSFCIDYVIIHELAHIAYKNHGKGFWLLVAFFCPDYRIAQSWLKVNGWLVNTI